MGRASEYMIEQDSNIHNRDKNGWIESHMSYYGEKFEEDSDEWNKLSEEFDDLANADGRYPENYPEDDNDGNPPEGNPEYLNDLPADDKYKKSSKIKKVYNRSSFHGMREGGTFINKEEYTIAHYESNNHRLEEVADNIKMRILEHFVLYEFKGNIETDNDYVIDVLNDLYPNGMVNTNDGASLTIPDFITDFPELEEISQPSITLDNEKHMFDYILMKLAQKEYPLSSLTQNKKLFDTKYVVDIAIEYDNQIIGCIETKRNMLANGNETRLVYSKQDFQQLKMYSSIIMTNQKIIPRMFLVEFTIDTITIHEYDIETNELSIIELFPEYISLTKAQLNKKKKHKNHPNMYTSLNSDVPKGTDIDSLEIDNDVNAFAKLITYKKVQTPLSIGLFGKWGSGKSFFMEKLSDKIEEFANIKDDDTFCNDVVHVKFNAWHYSDTNLWASLVHEIFGEIDNKISDLTKDDDPDEQKSLFYKQMKSAESRRRQLNEQKIEIVRRIKSKESEIVDEENNLKEFGLKDIDINLEVFNDPIIQKQVETIKENIGVSNDINLQTINTTYKELTDTFGIYGKAAKLLFTNINLKLISCFLIITGTIFAISYFIFELSIWQDMILPVVINGWALILLIQKKLKDTRSLTKKIKKILDKHDNLKLKKEKKEKQKLDRLKKELAELTEATYKCNKKQEDLKNEIQYIDNGKYFKEFISSKIDSDNYSKHLGLISVIRDDFKTLAKFLPSAYKNKKYKIDRIVLYIDDLDRCSDDLVVEVLEAVHLMLAFDLFVVVVGVDSRWIKGSLENKYKNFLNKKIKITPKQYIEKIFQIPFIVKALNEEDKQRFVKNLLKDNPITENLSQNDEAKTNPSNRKEENDIPKSSKTVNSTELTLKDKKETKNKEKIHARLQLTQGEVEYIEKMANLTGETPRTIKRFINTYRIIRSHSEINKILDDTFDSYKLIVLLLCETLWNESKAELTKKESKKEVFFDILSEDIQKDYVSHDEIKKELTKFIKRFSFDV